MKQTKLWILLVVLASVLMTACNEEEKKSQISEADKLIEASHKNKNYNELMKVVDSLEANGKITPTKACYWRGYACDKMKRQRLAEYYWKASLDAAKESTDDDEMVYYAKSASRLANMLSVRGDYEEGKIPFNNLNHEKTTYIGNRIDCSCICVVQKRKFHK